MLILSNIYRSTFSLVAITSYVLDYISVMSNCYDIVWMTKLSF